MVNFRFSAIYKLLAELSLLILVSSHNMKYQDVNPDVVENEAISQANDGVLWIVDTSDKIFSESFSAHIVFSTKKLRYWLAQSPQKWSELNTRARALRDIIETELGQHLYYRYPKHKAEKLLLWKSEWERAIGTFSEIERDVFSAVDCYALQHNTAAVFHCMRILERFRCLGS